MKGLCILLCVGMVAALLWANRGELAAFAEQQGIGMPRGAPRVQYVEREPERVYKHVWESPEYQQSIIEDSRERAAMSRAQRRYEYALENGLIASGAGDVDEALSVHKRLDYLPRSKWPQRWRDRLFRGQDEVAARADRSEGPDEEMVGASESTPPAWAGHPAGMREQQKTKSVPTGTALRRFFFGTEDSEREDGRL